MYLHSESRMNRQWSVESEPVSAGGSLAFSEEARSELLAWGEHIAKTRGCGDCHGEDLGGGIFADDMPVMRLSGSNLTPAGIGGKYDDADWMRAIRHGIGPDGKGLLFMPSYEYYYMSDEDLAALIVYLKSLPPVERTLEENAVGPVGRVLFTAGKLPLLAAEIIEHEAPRPAAPPKAATMAYGEYLSKGCIGCHGEGFSGGPIPGVPPSWPEAANLTPDRETGIGRWSREEFVVAFTRGLRPDGRRMEPLYMPWPNFAEFEKDEVEAIWMYLQSLDPKAKGGR